MIQMRYSPVAGGSRLSEEVLTASVDESPSPRKQNFVIIILVIFDV